MRVLMTGATGFVGGHVLAALHRADHELTVLKRSTSPSDVLRRFPGVRTYDLDRADDDLGGVEAPFHEGSFDAPFDVVVHVATNYGRTGEPPSRLVEDNLLLPLRLFETATDFGTRLIVNTDTFWTPNTNAYALCKHQLVQWMQSGLRERPSAAEATFVNLELQHPYGPGDRPRKFVPWLLDNYDADVERIPLTSCEQRRDFVYVEDAAAAYAAVLEARQDLAPGYHAFQVGSGAPRRVRDFVLAAREAFERLSERPLHTVLDFGARPYREGEQMDVSVDLAPLQELGWRPTWTLESGLDTTVRAYLAAREPETA